MIRQACFSNRGFNIVGTLLAIAIGGIVAALVALVVSRAVRSQHNLPERDDLNEFSTFIKGVLKTDSTCSSALHGQAFKPGGQAELQLNVGYANATASSLKAGSVISRDNLQIESIRIEDRSPNTIGFKVEIADADGKARIVTVRRHLARVMIRMKNDKSSEPYKPFSFEFPILYNVSEKKIEMCNNEINIGDACQAMGFRWDATSIPPQCVTTNSCMYGGAYTLKSNGACAAQDQNPATQACSCPVGYTAVSAGSVNLISNCAKGCDSVSYDSVIQCFKCPGSQ